MDATPLKLHLKKDEKLEIAWSDGQTSTYSLTLLRTMCPCAQCRGVREGKAKAAEEPAATEKPKRGISLGLLPGNFAEPLRATGAQRVGNYAIKIDWSDAHSSGIYSFAYLREIRPNGARQE